MSTKKRNDTRSNTRSNRVHGDPVLSGILDLLGRPAVAISDVGATLAANEAFRRLGIAAPSEFFIRLTSSSRARVMSAISAGSYPARIEVEFHDGRTCTVHLAGMEVIGSSRPAYLAVFENHRVRSKQTRAPALHHDLAGPLTAVLGTAELLLLRERELSRDVRDSLGQILENCGRMSEILMRDRHAAAERSPRDRRSPGPPDAGKAAP